MSWIRPKRIENPAPVAPTAPVTASAVPARSAAVGIPDDDDEIPIDMASGTSPSTSPAPSPGAAVTRAAARPAGGGEGRTTLTDDTTVVGTITTASDLWIAGRVDGSIQSGAAVQIAADGAVKGDVNAQRLRVEHGGAIEGAVKTVEATIAGKIRGPVTASGRLAIAASGEVIGDVTAANLHVDDGATLQGRCTMSRRP